MELKNSGNNFVITMGEDIDTTESTERIFDEGSLFHFDIVLDVVIVHTDKEIG